MPTNYFVEAGGHLTGSIVIPGDKSISHRAVMLGAIANGVTQVTGILDSEDVLASIAAFRAMGVCIERPSQNQILVHGVGMQGLKSPTTTIECGNSATTMRLLTGLLAAQNFNSQLTGDHSLCKRPMQRIIIPLSQMGVRIKATVQGTAPLFIQGMPTLQGIDYTLPIASAQVKSAILLAALFARGKTTITEPVPTRDHTERMLQSLHYPVIQSGNQLSITGGGSLTAAAITIPADISSAAFFVVGAAISPHSDITLKQIGVNPTRTGIIDILKLMGADIQFSNHGVLGTEPVADIRVRYAPLRGIVIPPALVPLAIDEFPAILIAAANAVGDTLLTQAGELRFKESDRLNGMAEGLQTLGVPVKILEDGIRIEGKCYAGGEVKSHGDHRIAMAFAIAALTATSPVKILDCAPVATSFPGFSALGKQHGLRIHD